MPWDAFRALCERWAAIWGVPAVFLLVIGNLESSRVPGDANTTDPRAIGRGGAWGLFGMTLNTAKGLATKAGFRDKPEISSWDGTGPGLLEPDRNAAFAAGYLRELVSQFNGDFVNVLGAYHSGPGNVANILARGGNVATDLGPFGRQYVAKGLALRAELEGAGVS